MDRSQESTAVPRWDLGAWNGWAILSLVAGVLSFGAFGRYLLGAGLLLGVVALVLIRKRGGRGRRLAFAGMALSSAALLFHGLIAVLVLLGHGEAENAAETLEEAAARDASVFALRPGDCFDFSATAWGSAGHVDEVQQVPCEEVHEAELFAVAELPRGAYPGGLAIEVTARRECGPAQHAYAPDTWALPDGVASFFLHPTPESWEQGDRDLLCVFRGPQEGLRGSVRQDSGALDEHQLVYLTATHVFHAAWEAEPAEYAYEDLEANQKWAGLMAEALGDQARQLGEHAWPDEASAPVGALILELEEARLHWERARDASHAAAFDTLDTSGLQAASERTVEVRRALRLPTE
ncbi:septum formation family protein [Streptomyces sp. ACA25]|uniref:septum formation family protein n=1 Tax=Streptomyces sp. ACA25 TaxID=3022596 RepID=UPI002308076F|nr:septum formation family protein [Streptomyces sp. ACA25]MDB1086912.1 septum formation family protein [Streptomyces sp. ACA25]